MRKISFEAMHRMCSIIEKFTELEEEVQKLSKEDFQLLIDVLGFVAENIKKDKDFVAKNIKKESQKND